jgi:hypothetical protein
MRTYSPRKVVVTWTSAYNGGVVLTGYAPDTFIKATRNEDSFAVDVGADGEVARVASANRSGTVEITLQQVSASNDDLTNDIQQDELSQDNTGTLQIADASGRTILLASEAWIKKPTDVEFASGKGTRTWPFETGNLEMYDGGN